MNEKTTFDRTRAALAVYDAGAVERAKNWEDICNDAEVAVAQKADADALDKVRMAFWEDTKEFNSVSSCRQVPLNFMRLCAQKP